MLSDILDVIDKINHKYRKNYIYDQFCILFKAYIKSHSNILDSYFGGNQDLNAICYDFIHFCFSKNILLNSVKTLSALENHDQICDNAIKERLRKIEHRSSLNLMGFGLGDGTYEKFIAMYLKKKNIAKDVNLFGFDPFAKKIEGIKLVTVDELLDNKVPKLDIIIARWVLHHVDEKYRWENFIHCISSMNPCSMVLIIEHGFLQDGEVDAFSIDRKLYSLINAAFDVVVNIAIRPHWFTSTPKLGCNFFVRYLTSKDIKSIKKQANCIIYEKIRHLGPDFPNQSLFCFET